MGAFSGGAPCGATKRVRGVPKRVWPRNVRVVCRSECGGACGYGATKRVRGVPK